MPNIDYGPAFDIAQQWMHELDNKQPHKKGLTKMAQRFQIDDIVYFKDEYGAGPCYGTVTAIARERSSGIIFVTLANVKEIKEPLSSTNYKHQQVVLKQEICEASEADLYAAIAVQERAAQDIYRQRINSIRDLIQFALNEDVSGKSFRIEIDEPDAATEIRHKRIVFIEKAQELLGLSNLPVEFPEDCCI